MRLAVIGLGLIGASLIQAARRAGMISSVAAFDTDPDALRSGLAAGLIDFAAPDPATAAVGADVCVFAVPVGAMAGCFTQLKEAFAGGKVGVWTDVGSTKASVIEDAKQVLGAVPNNFVPGHPLAGAERSGVAAGNVDLFCDRRVILTPTAETSLTAVDVVTRLWESVGAEVEQMPALEHDRLMAFTSHLPHVLAYAMVECLADNERRGFRYAAGGFRDFTRIASSDPVMWRDIAIKNRAAILSALDRFETSLRSLRLDLEAENSAELERHFAVAKSFRDGLLKA